MIQVNQSPIPAGLESATNILPPQELEEVPSNKLDEIPAKEAEKELIQHVETHVKVGEFVKSAVYGGLDGVITTFMIVLSGFGGGTAVSTILGIGVSSLVADALSMAIADFVATQSDGEYMEMQKARQQKQIQNDFAAEKRQMVNIYKELGINQDDSNQIVEILAKKPEGFLKVMLVEQLGIIADEQTPFINCVVTFFAFGVFGLMPLLPLIVAKGAKLPWRDIYILVSGILTFVFLFILGLSKSIVTMTKWYWSCLQTIGIGAISAAVAYGIGKALGE